MKDMLDIPKNRKRLNAGRLCLLLGLTLLLYLTVANQLGMVSELVLSLVKS